MARNKLSADEKVGEIVAIYLRNAVWYVRYQHKGNQVRQSLRTKSKKEARIRALRIERDILTGDYQQVVEEPPLIKEVIEEYMDYLRAEGRSPKTLSKYENCFKHFNKVTSQAKVSRISQVNLRLINKFRATRAKGPGRSGGLAKPKTIHNDTVVIRQLVNFAIRCGMIKEDPLATLKLKKPKRTPQPCWTRPEVERILAAANANHRPVLRFLAETGARIGEAVWLTWDDVDLEKRLILIRPKEGWRPKSGDERAVPINVRLHAGLSNLKRKGKWVFQHHANKESDPDRQVADRRLLAYLKRLLSSLGLEGHLHTFRHSFISFAAIQGVPERILRKWIGHVDREILDWYFHLADSESHEAMKRLSDAVDDESLGDSI